MDAKSIPWGLAALLLICGQAVEAQRKPAPEPSRYGYTLEVDEESLPKGVTVKKVVDGKNVRHFIKNASDVPLVINERFQNDVLVTGSKLVDGKVYGYFPNGVPMEGKTHLKGWQAPFGDIDQTILMLPRDPDKIYEGRKAGLSKKLPPDEETSIAAKYDDQPYEIKVTIRYHLNDAYDVHHGLTEK